MAEQAYAYVTLIPVAKGFQSAVAKQLSGVGGAGGTAGKAAGEGFKSKFGGALKGLAAVAGTAIAAAGVGKFFSDSVKQASDLNESINAINVSFGANAKGIANLGKEAATSLGLSTQEFNQLAVGFTAFSEKIAGPGGDVVGVIDDLTTRGADFASVMNLEVSDALTLFRSGLSGETEPLRRFGIDVSEAQVKIYAYANGIAETGAELTEAQKVQARYGTIMEQTSRMQGDFANTSDQLANATRIVKSQFKDLQAEIGSALLPALQELMPTIIPIVEKAAPLLVSILESAIPVIEALAANMEPLFDAIAPLIEVFGLLAETAGEIIAAILPPFIEILAILTPIVLQLAEAFLPIVEKLLPPFLNLVDALIPILEFMGEVLTDIVVPIVSALIDALSSLPIFIIDGLTTALENLWSILGPVFNFLKDVVGQFLEIGNITPASLDKEIKVTTKFQTVGTPPYGESLSGLPDWLRNSIMGTGGGTVTTPTTISTGGGMTAAEIKERISGFLRDTNRALRDARDDYDKAIGEANKDYARTQLEIAERYEDAITAATERRDQAMAEALKNYNRSVADINEQSAKALEDVIKQSMDRLREAFRSVAEVNIAEMFSSDAINKNIGGLIDGLREKLTASRRLMENAAALASQGFSQTFIEQVVAAGAETGNQLAEGILNATPDQQRELQDLFGIIETEAAHGMDSLAETLYEKNGLATEELRQMYEQVLTDQQESLAKQKRLYDEAISDIMAQFNQEVTNAAETRDEALADAELALNEALLKANESFLESLDKIEEQFGDKIASMKGKVAGFSKDIDSLVNKISNFQNDTALNINGLQSLIPFADGGLVTGPTPALIGEAGPELVIPLNQFQSMAEAAGGGKSLNYYAAPNQSVDSEQALFQAMRRAKVVANW